MAAVSRVRTYGLAYIVPPVQTWNFEVGVAGAGFLAMAVMIARNVIIWRQREPFSSRVPKNSAPMHEPTANLVLL